MLKVETARVRTDMQIIASKSQTLQDAPGTDICENENEPKSTPKRVAAENLFGDFEESFDLCDSALETATADVLERPSVTSQPTKADTSNIIELSADKYLEFFEQNIELERTSIDMLEMESVRGQTRLELHVGESGAILQQDHKEDDRTQLVFDKERNVKFYSPKKNNQQMKMNDQCSPVEKQDESETEVVTGSTTKSKHKSVMLDASIVKIEAVDSEAKKEMESELHFVAEMEVEDIIVKMEDAENATVIR